MSNRNAIQQLARQARRLLTLFGSQGQKRTPFIWPVASNGVVQWQMGDFQTYVREGYSLNSLIYSAVMYKARSAAQARLRAYEGDPENPVRLPLSHPLARLVMRPNLYQSWSEFSALITVYLNLAGNAYILIDRSKAKQGVPSALYPLRPDRVFLIPKDGRVAGYLYCPEGHPINDGIPILFEDMIHIKFPNPLDPFEGMGYGMSPMTPLARSGDVDNTVTKFLKVFFDKGALPVGLLKYKIPLDHSQVSAIKSRWRSIYGGVDNWADIGVLDMDAEYVKMSHSFDEMGFEKIDERNETRILGPFGVPPILIGTRFGLMRSTDTNYKNARRAFWEDTMSFELTLQEDEFEYYLAGDDATFVKYDLSSVPALQEDIPSLVEAAHKMFLMGVPSNQAFAAVGLRVPKTAVGDIPFVSSSVIAYNEDGGLLNEYTPASSRSAEAQSDGTSDEGQEGDKSETEAEGQKGSGAPAKHALPADEAKKKRLVNRIDEIAESHEAKFMEAAAEAFEEDMRAILSLVRDLKTKSLLSKQTINWSTLSQPIIDYLNVDANANWRATFVPLLVGVVNDVGQDWSSQLGIRFDLRHIMAEEWFEDYTLKFAQPIIQTTSDFIQDILAQGQREGWSHDQMARRLQTVFRQWQTGSIDPDEFEWLEARTPIHRAQMIARTETIRAANAGSHALYKSWGVQKKEWSATLDARTRDSHRRANGQVVNLDQPFNVGGWNMMYPGDTSYGAPPSEFVQCRCSVLPVIEDMQAIQSAAERLAGS